MDWIAGYLDYTQKQVSPRLFHYWSAIAVLAGSVERRVWFDTLDGDKRIYPGQLMVVLVSKSAITKKTTAARMAVRFIRDTNAGGPLDPWQCYVLPDALSPQQIYKSLERLDEDKVPTKDPDGRRVNSAGFIFAEELGTFFTKQVFAEDLATIVNKLNDCPPRHLKTEYRTYQVNLWQPCITMLGCITPKGIAEELPRTARTAGFFGRILWVYQEHTDRARSLMDRSSPEAGLGHAQLRKELREEIRTIASMRGAFTATKQAREWYNGWYYDVYEPWVRKQDFGEGEHTGYWGRKDTHVLLVAMVLSMARSRERIYRREDLEKALRSIEDIERFFPQAMAELGTNPHTTFDRRFVEILERMGQREPWVAESRLRKALRRYGGDRDFRNAIDTLVPSEDIEGKRVNDVRYWKRRYSSGRLLRAAGEEQ